MSPVSNTLTAVWSDNAVLEITDTGPAARPPCCNAQSPFNMIMKNNHLAATGLTRSLALPCLLALCSLARAEIEFQVTGVDDALRENILNHNDTVRLGRSDLLSDRELGGILKAAEDRARDALRPYGYYQPAINGRFFRRDDDQPVIELNVEPGPAVIVRELEITIEGPGEKMRELRSWRTAWPLKSGTRLNQIVWEREKQAALDIAASNGYLEASFSSHEIALDLDNNAAALKLNLQTGRRFVIGDIDFGEHVLKPGIIEYVPRFQPGDPYSARLMDDFRLDLWRTGYFTDVDVSESRRTDVSPPVVDLRVELATATRNSFQGALGYGTDTGVRLQTSWSKHPFSNRGDRVDIGIGWQELNDEFAVRGTYKLPILQRTREYWIADATIRFENQDLELKRDNEDENFLKIANGNVDERHVKLGWLKVFNLKSGEKQTFLTPFVQYLNSERDYDLLAPDTTIPGTLSEAEFGALLHGTDNALSAGVDIDIVAIVGKSFETRGRRDRAWIFGASRSAGSETDFVQAYLSTRRSILRGERWKFIVRAEVGYTEADVDAFSVDVDGVPLQLSVTELPNFYRFKAGGSASVRGYAFEELSNNNIGSNNIVTASAEVEYRLTNKWSVAAFADIGNAFNDWSEPELKLGTGIGVRWYSIAGPIRLDIAQARDFVGKPWRVHVTIGTPLL